MLTQLFEFLTLLIKRDAEVLAAGMVGIALGALGAGRLAWKHLRRPCQTCQHHEDVIGALSRDLERMKDENSQLHEKSAALESAVRRMGEESARLSWHLKEAGKVFDDANRQIDSLSKQIQTVLESDGRIWEVAPGQKIPRFVPHARRRAAIVAVANLKGGVGKTTVTANLGASIAALGKEVLIIDLDHQHSLSDLCFHEGRRQDLKRAGRLVDRLFQPGEADSSQLRSSIERVGNRKLSILVSDEDLADVETRAMARWLVNDSERDVRYVLRASLHSQEVSSRFDWIFIDCPPRLTTCTVNALTACDFVLVPVLLDAPSVNAAPRLLRWLYRLKSESHICPDLSVLGIVANGTSQSPSLTPSERDQWTHLARSAADSWTQPVYCFERFVPRKVAFAQAAQANTFAAESNGLKAIFRDLATEIQQRVPSHERRDAVPVSSHA